MQHIIAGDIDMRKLLSIFKFIFSEISEAYREIMIIRTVEESRKYMSNDCKYTSNKYKIM